MAKVYSIVKVKIESADNGTNTEVKVSVEGTYNDKNEAIDALNKGFRDMLHDEYGYDYDMIGEMFTSGPNVDPSPYDDDSDNIYITEEENGFTFCDEEDYLAINMEVHASELK